MQHVALRLQIRPYLDQLVWEKILRKTDWITCLRLNHISIGKELLPPEGEAQAMLDSAVACGDVCLVRRMLQTFDGVPDMDTAAKADHFKMLNFLDGLDKAGFCICRATRKMAGYAAANCNLVMLEWLITNRLEVDGGEMLPAAAGAGNVFVIYWIFQQAEQYHRVYINDFDARQALCNALQAGHLEIALLLIDRFSFLQSVACKDAIKHACLSDVQRVMSGYLGDPDGKEWYFFTVYCFHRGEPEILSTVLDIMQTVEGRFPEQPPGPLFDIAAEYSTVDLMQTLLSHLPDEVKKMHVTDEAMVTAAERGDSDMVSLTRCVSPQDCCNPVDLHFLPPGDVRVCSQSVPADH